MMPRMAQMVEADARGRVQFKAPLIPQIVWRSANGERVKVTRDRPMNRWQAFVGPRWGTGDSIEEAVDAVNLLYHQRAHISND